MSAARDVRSIASGKARSGLPLLRLALLAVAALLVEGYHFGVDDGAIYIPAVEHAANPSLFPFGSEFFLSHASLSMFGATVGRTARLFHLSLETAVFSWHLLCIVALLAAAWAVASVLFETAQARWGAVTLLAATLPVPVAGTALFLSDNYLSARSFSSPCGLVAIALFLRGKRWWAGGALLLTAAFHPLMATYCAALLAVLWMMALRETGHTHQPRSSEIGSTVTATLSVAASALTPHSFLGLNLQPATGAYRDVLYSRTYFFARQWHAYEWLGIVAPLVMLAALGYSRRISAPALQRVSRALLLLGSAATVAFLVISSSSHFDSLTRLQPMRMFHLVYLLFFLVLGGLLGEWVLQQKPLCWLLLFVPLTTGMFALDRSMYPDSPHLELPERPSANPWLQAFRWIRANTPSDAVFALDPEYTAIRGEDTHGFRAVAERSVLADAIKDSGAVTMFPQLLRDWQDQQNAQRGWRQFGPREFLRLHRTTPVSWVVVQPPQDSGLPCPYRNQVVAVCRIDHLAP